MADRITDSTKIKKTQIQQKTSDGLIAIRPETETDLVLNSGTNITGDTVNDVFENAKEIKSSDGSINISLVNGYIDFVVASAPVTITLNGTSTTNPSFYAPTIGGTSGYLLKSNGTSAPTWVNPNSVTVGNATTAAKISDGSITYTPSDLQSKLAGLSKYLGTASSLSTLTGSTADAGDFYRVTGSFTVKSETAHVGDLVILKPNATSTAEANWEVIHTGDNTNTTYTLKAGSTANIVELWADGASAATSSITVNNVTNAAAATTASTAGKVSNKVTFNNGGSGAASGTAYDGSAAVTVSYNTLGISATTTSVTVGSTTFNKYVHPTTAGNKHIPSGGSANQILAYSAAGTAQWTSLKISNGVNTSHLSISGGVGTLTLPSSGVTAGTYSAVAVNSYGIVTGGSQVIGYYATTDTIGNELATGGFAFVEV